MLDTTAPFTIQLSNTHKQTNIQPSQLSNKLQRKPKPIHTFSCTPSTHRISAQLSHHRQAKLQSQQQYHDKHIQSMWKRINSYQHEMIKQHNPTALSQHNCTRSTNNQSMKLPPPSCSSNDTVYQLADTHENTRINDVSAIDFINDPYVILKSKLIELIECNNIYKPKNIHLLLDKARTINTHLDIQRVNEVCEQVLIELRVDSSNHADDNEIEQLTTFSI